MIIEKLFLIFSNQISISTLKRETIALPSVWGGWVKEITSEEFPFENINNLTAAKVRKILNGDFAENAKVKRA